MAVPVRRGVPATQAGAVVRAVTPLAPGGVVVPVLTLVAVIPAALPGLSRRQAGRIPRAGHRALCGLSDGHGSHGRWMGYGTVCRSSCEGTEGPGAPP